MAGPFDSDYFGSGFFGAGYFGNDQAADDGAMSASLVGGASLSAALTAAAQSVSVAGGKRKTGKARRRPLSWPMFKVTPPTPVFVAASIGCAGATVGTMAGPASISADMSGGSYLEASGVAWSRRQETTFWLMAA